VCVVYRPPGTTESFWDNFDYSLEQALNFTEDIIITGDLNVDLLTQTNHKLNEIMTLYDLTNVINEPTRMGAILDPVIVSNIDIVVDSEVIGGKNHQYQCQYPIYFRPKWLSVTQIIDDSETMSSKYDNLFRTLRAFK
jgi:hypothetical protein